MGLVVPFPFSRGGEGCEGAGFWGTWLLEQKAVWCGTTGGLPGSACCTKDRLRDGGGHAVLVSIPGLAQGPKRSHHCITIIRTGV